MAVKGTKSTLERWEKYLNTTETYGMYNDRIPEYRLVGKQLMRMGLANDDLIVDVGAGSCDMDHWLRTSAGWRGRYLPIDGATTGTDLEGWKPSIPADWFVCIETLEHVTTWEPLLKAMIRLARKGVVVATPNGAVVDVLSTDPTHVAALTQKDLEKHGMTIEFYNLNPQQGNPSTLFGHIKTQVVTTPPTTATTETPQDQ